MSTTLVKNGTIVTAADRYVGDIYIDKGVITLIGQALNMPADTVIEASGKLVFPGGIDVHTHLDMPFGGTTSSDDFESGTMAAAHGGTTTLIDFAIQNRLKRVEAGAQGEHKLARGYMPVTTYSAHYIADPGLRRAIADYLKRERAYVEAAGAELSAMGPFRKDLVFEQT